MLVFLNKVTGSQCGVVGALFALSALFVNRFVMKLAVPCVLDSLPKYQCQYAAMAGGQNNNAVIPYSDGSQCWVVGALFALSALFANGYVMKSAVPCVHDSLPKHHCQSAAMAGSQNSNAVIPCSDE
jgi:hypothetical protein